ncbi:response regulator [Rugamonas sp.]|uniref:response regulator n=1 Tax=Rugamonas sp. TaxID=1926287 RepID=UPI0025EC0776|nr:response regulator [Rugamonas sp.]
MKGRLPCSAGNILVASDSNSDAVLIKRLLGEEFSVVNISLDPDQAVEDFERYLPQVLILAFNRIENSEQYCLGLFRGGAGKTQRHPHRSILLCDKGELLRAYQLCQRNLFDDYNLFWPMSQDPQRLPMSVHMALRELNAASANAPRADEMAELGAAARHLAELDTLLAQQVTLGRERIRDDASLASWNEGLRHAVQPYIETATALQQWLPAPHAPVILVVDDDEVERHLIGAILKDEPYHLVYVGSAREALIVLRTVHPDLILMDVQMPDVDGLAATRQIKAAPQFAAVPVIMITGNSETRVVMDSYRSGATDFVVKPFDRDKLIARVAAGLRHKGARPTTPA